MRHLEPIIERNSEPVLSELLNASWFVPPAGEPRAGIMPADGGVGVVVAMTGSGRTGVGSVVPDSAGFDAVHLRLAPEVSLVGLRFEPGAFLSLFGLSFRNFVSGQRTRQLAAIEETLQAGLRELTRDTCTFGQVQCEVARVLTGSLVDPNPQWLRMRNIADEMCASDECISSEQWARRAGLCRRQFERLFVEHVGWSPKVFLRLQRVNRARWQLRGGAGLARTAQVCGFADQAHLTREFRRVLGVTPLAYRGRPANPQSP